ncbi:uncharacterized protein LOC110679710 [Aedes aegypti]|uniref:ZP domain-containing protein n=1 Tax=Aedes aegypti TaxID=7159 RepID=A0A1S4EZ54_AEDAE|nr:uncharacterized protein LOC5571122 [Aedes aegypti]XP_021711032.1 uncharacterized protein LOC110679710 [Aedes aegypti]
MIGKVLIIALFTVQSTRSDVFTSKSITRALVPPRKDSEYKNGYSTTLLPEVIINRQPTRTTITPQRDFQGYFYNPPTNEYIPPEPPFADEPQPPAQRPPLSDEYPSVDNQYLPPEEDSGTPDDTQFADPPVNDYLPPPQLPPQRDEIIIVTTESGYQYNPPSSPIPPFADEGFSNPSTDTGYNYDRPANAYIPPLGRALRDEVPGGSRPIRLQLNDLTCLDNIGGFFRSSLTIQSAIESVPLVDVTSDSDLNGCDVRVAQNRLLVDIESNNFARCGVQQCGVNSRELCLRLRFPQIAGMRTAADSILTLQCKIQQRVVAKTHSVRLGVNNDVQERSASGTFAYGGTQRPFRTQLGLFRRSDNGNGFTRALEPGGSVVLGEELMLRTQVRSGDGWNFTRLSEVVMQRQTSAGSVLNSATVVTTNGCLNPTMRAISSVAPVAESPLSYRLNFRAAMFQGMRSGDEMVMRVRIVGCVDRRECAVENCATVRSKRDTADNSTEDTSDQDELPSEVSTISFRIMLPSNSTIDLRPGAESTRSFLTLSVAVIISVVMLVALIVLITVIKLYRTKQLHYDEYRSD